MKTLRRYIVREIVLATAMVMAALLMLFAFFDLVEEIKDLGRGAYQMPASGALVDTLQALRG